jgi:hypothetical protein
MFFITLLFGLATFMTPADVPVAMHDSAPVQRSVRQRLRVIRTRPFPSVSTPNWEGHFSAQKFQKTREDRIALLKVKQNVKKVLSSFEPEQINVLKNLVIKNQKHASRGMANSKKIILHTESIETDDEMVSVLIHELGHVTDLGGLKSINGGASAFVDRTKTFFNDDLSVDFYSLSWKDSDTLKMDIVHTDFVSGYAMSNCFEDFAESFLFYRMHGEKFRYLGESSDVLSAKYDFFKEHVFAGKEFQTEKEVSAEFVAGKSLVWDATMLEL